MKTLITLAALAALLAPGRARAEGEDGAKVLIEDTYLDNGYTAFGVKLVQGGGKAGAFAAVQGGWDLGADLTMGLVGEVLVSRVSVERNGASALNMGFLGLFAEYDVLEKDAFGLTAGFATGLGEAGYRIDDERALIGGGTAKAYERSALFFAEPTATGLVHVSHRLDLALSLGYRYARGAKIEGLSPGAFGGAAAALGLRGHF